MKSKKNVNETKLVCPNCGAEFEIAEHECKVENATVIGADSGVGTIYMKLKDRQEQLTKAGIDVSKYFSMKTPDGTDRLMKWEDNTPVAVTSDDPVLKAILDSGTVPNRDLFRRWVMAQVFQGLVYAGYYGHGFTSWVHSKGYNYTWKMTEEELRVQIKLYKKDMENFNERNCWFNGDVALDMANYHIAQVKKIIHEKELKHIHKCKGVPYICIGGQNVFVADIQKKIIDSMELLRDNILQAKDDPIKLYAAFKKFNSRKINLNYDTTCCPRWMDAYKGAGAFYTMKNMILFHNCFMRDEKGRIQSKNKSLDMLMGKADEYTDSGWRLFGLLRKFISDNGVDIVKKRQEWAAAKKLRMRNK